MNDLILTKYKYKLYKTKLRLSSILQLSSNKQQMQQSHQQLNNYFILIKNDGNIKNIKSIWFNRLNGKN